MPIDFADESRLVVRAFLAAYNSFEVTELDRASGGEDGLTGARVARNYLAAGMTPEHLVTGFHLLFRKVAILAANTASESAEAIVQMCATRIGAWAAESEGDGHALVEEDDGLVRIDPYISARAILGYFTATDEVWDMTLDSTVAMEMLDAAQLTVAGIDAVVEGSLRVIESAYECWLVALVMNHVELRALVDASEPEARPVLVRDLCEELRGDGLTGLATFVRQVVADLG